jgi:hypothetical protein
VVGNNLPESRVSGCTGEFWEVLCIVYYVLSIASDPCGFIRNTSYEIRNTHQQQCKTSHLRPPTPSGFGGLRRAAWCRKAHYAGLYAGKSVYGEILDEVLDMKQFISDNSSPADNQQEIFLASRERRKL